MEIDKVVTEVVSCYFDKVDEDNALNQVIADKAKECELNSEEIHRVVQMSNVKIFEKLFDATNDRSLEFDLADPDEVINMLGTFERGKREIDNAYEINPRIEEEDDGIDIDMDELKEEARKKKQKEDELKLMIHEKTPKIKRKIKKKIQNRNPSSVVFAIKEAAKEVLPLVKEVCEEENILEKEANICEEALLKEYSDFLSDIKDYAKMKVNLEKVSSDLEKIAGIKKILGKGLTAANRINKINKTKDKVNIFKQEQRKGGTKSLGNRKGERNEGTTSFSRNQKRQRSPRR